MDQDQQRVRRYRDFGQEGFRLNLLGSQILPAHEKLHPCFFISAIAFRFGLLVPNFAL